MPRRAGPQAGTPLARSGSWPTTSPSGISSGSSEAEGRPSGSLTFSGNLDEDVSGHATSEDLNKANDKFWSDRLSRPRTQDGAGRGVSARATPESINEANAAYWSGQPTHRLGREFGKG